MPCKTSRVQYYVCWQRGTAGIHPQHAGAVTAGGSCWDRYYLYIDPAPPLLCRQCQRTTASCDWYTIQTQKKFQNMSPWSSLHGDNVLYLWKVSLRVLSSNQLITWLMYRHMKPIENEEHQNPGKLNLNQTGPGLGTFRTFSRKQDWVYFKKKTSWQSPHAVNSWNKSTHHQTLPVKRTANLF